jgi:uncharacterized phage infection (PIP) family protein YhgE
VGEGNCVLVGMLVAVFGGTFVASNCAGEQETIKITIMNMRNSLFIHYSFPIQQLQNLFTLFYYFLQRFAKNFQAVINLFSSDIQWRNPAQGIVIRSTGK